MIRATGTEGKTTDKMILSTGTEEKTTDKMDRPVLFIIYYIYIFKPFCPTWVSNRARRAGFRTWPRRAEVVYQFRHG